MKTLLDILKDIKAKGLGNPTLTMNALDIEIHRQEEAYQSHEDWWKENWFAELTKAPLEIYGDGDRPFCRAAWYEEAPEPQTGLNGCAMWVMAEDQKGTMIEEMRKGIDVLVEVIGR